MIQGGLPRGGNPKETDPREGVCVFIAKAVGVGLLEITDRDARMLFGVLGEEVR